MKITFEVVDVESGEYAYAKSYPHDGLFLWIEKGDGWIGAASVKDGEVKYGLFAQKHELVIADVLSYAEDAVEDDPILPPPLTPKIALRDSEAKTHSYEDVLRALAAAAGTLPSDLM